MSAIPPEPPAPQSPAARSARSDAARALKRPDERVKYDAGDCDELGKASQRCLERVGFDRAVAAIQCKQHYEAYRDCRRAVTAAKRKDVPSLFG